MIHSARNQGYPVDNKALLLLKKVLFMMETNWGLSGFGIFAGYIFCLEQEEIVSSALRMGLCKW